MKRTLMTMVAAGFVAVGAMAQTATFKYFSYEGNDARFDKAIDNANEYFNPVMAGFYPDPSICRKGDTYYLVNSSFSFFPGVPIFESKDLVNWKQIGNVLDRESQLPLYNQGVSGGIFAPAISYNEKNKTFYMITTNIARGNFFVKTQDPAKGWSEPIYLKEVGGIDPSFYFDKNGKAYIVNNDAPSSTPNYEGERSIWIREFDVKNDCVIGEQKEIVRGGTHVVKNPIWIEGPHLFKEGKYYYLMCAEGGTCDFHSEVILRAKDPMGPWEEYTEGNPILTQRTGLDPKRPDIVTSAGHADLVKGPKGDWWAVFLACRPYQDDFYNTGRDTYLLPVTWKDGWPTILDKGLAIPTVNKKAGLQYEEGLNNTGNFKYTDNFDNGKLDMRWMYLRNPDFSAYSLGDNGLTIKASDANIYERKPLSAVFRRQQHNTFTVETEVTFNPSNEKEMAGFALLQNEDYNFTFGKTKIGNRYAIVLTRAEKTNVVIGSKFLCEKCANKPVKLRIHGDGRYYDFSFSMDGKTWNVMARGVDAVNLSTHQSGGFIGACIGLYATKNK